VRHSPTPVLSLALIGNASGEHFGIAEAHQHGMEQIARKATALAAGTSGTAMLVDPSLPH
jgi:hypothetical protein